MSAVVALDLGTTRIKAGALGGDGRFEATVSRDAPPVSGDDAGLIRESDPAAYLSAATAALDEVVALAGGRRNVRLGLASQRSSFVLWDPRSGKTETPLISWQDRRAARWCEGHRADEPRVREHTGLPLSPHYAGPKLASLLERRPALRAALTEARLLFGTLETYLVWSWTGREVHETDPTMAARTLLADPRRSVWSAGMLELFAVPPAALPRIVGTAGRATPLARGATLAASVADQAAGVLALLGSRPDSALVNLGTGGFVLRPTGRRMTSRAGYLAGPILARTDRGDRGDGPLDTLYALEGTINGAGLAVDRFGAGPTELPRTDPQPDAFCLPDVAGTGSPHWLPDRTLTLSPAATALDDAGRRRVVIEGLAFRVREILEDLFDEVPPAAVRLAGGLSRDPAVGAALAACLGRPVEVAEESEGTLLGAARLAAGTPPARWSAPPLRTVTAGDSGAYLHTKFERWKRWLGELLAVR